ncbi:hypothetical protein IVB32_29900 [Bradyrhizobium sp. 23]|nr:hypothetical protein [Bradyrhizobium sp. 23]
MPNEEMGSRALPETAGIDNRAVLAIVGSFLLFVGAAIAGILLFLNSEAPGAFTPRAESRFPSPELQTSPEDDLTRFEAAQRARLTTYAWVDRDHNIARIPIDQAMQLVAGRGRHAYDALRPAPAPPPGASGGNP